MRRALFLAAFTTLALVWPALASATPTATELKERARSLTRRVGKHGLTVVVEAPFVVVGDEAPSQVRRRATGTLRWAVSQLESSFFERGPDQIIEIWIFRDERSYRRGAKRWFGDTPSTPYGYFSSSDRAIVMNIGPGAGTLVHEVVHPYLEANFPNVPSWFNEGLASLYERPTEIAGRIHGLPNWRLRNLKREIRADALPSIELLLATTSDAFYDAQFDAYAYARYLLYYLQEQGKLVDFYQRFRAARRDDPTGLETLREVLGFEDLDGFRQRWQRWVLGLELD